MKEIFKYIHWVWTNFEFWQKMFIFALFLQGISLGLQEPYNFWILRLSVAIILFFFVKWAVWDGVKSSWAKYKDHRNKLLTTIKTSTKE